MRIGELAERSGVSARSLRYYEQHGLLSPRRNRAGHRTYVASDVDRVVEIQELFAAGFCSAGVREVLPGVLDPASGDLARLGARMQEARIRLQRELREVERELEVLAGVQERLGLAPDTHVRPQTGSHDDVSPDPKSPTPAPTDHRNRRLR
ncbi:MerR family transcriptional regulator [Nocardioides aurantiacus]|uniref:DNA-binding transcriptional MerR regulator n=1 Tax=Nocardioides aurantiacus TaxID=86796 RepID=A0A3N2CU92_9ACTN|nr:MerR family transcriptional regulator [Nocardioides aurantiacus]ROR91100.1 DNA-binding transcriptional MerR regulator [Nocardioides aurantiacus]